MTSRMRNFHFATQCQQLAGKSAFSALEMYQPALILLKTATAFQADDEGSIPFTRSNVFKDLRHSRRSILTSGLLLILTNVRHLFTPLSASERPRQPVSWSAWRSAAIPWQTYVVPALASLRR
jgi:hypothetical protein